MSSSLTSVELHLTLLFIEMNTKAPTKSCVNSFPTRIKFKITLFLLCLKKLLRKSFGILAASANRKNCSQPRVSSVCNFKELSKWLSQIMSICEYPEDRLWTNLIIPSESLLKG